MAGEGAMLVDDDFGENWLKKYYDTTILGLKATLGQEREQPHEVLPKNLIHPLLV
jgi:hypothetical protein